jgi:hypothetical protein
MNKIHCKKLVLGMVISPSLNTPRNEGVPMLMESAKSL